jgi:outer membrane protein assembly factor BamB
MLLLRGLATTLLLTGLGLLLGCAARLHGPAIDPGPGLAPAGLSALPSPPAVLAAQAAARRASALSVLRLGREYEPGFSQRATESGDELAFAPDWVNNTAPFGQLAYAIYRFDLTGFTGVQNLNLNWSAAPDQSQLWLGFSRWSHGRWEWRQAPTAGQTYLGAQLADYTDASGQLLVAVVLAGGTGATLSQLRIGNAAPDDWAMYGRERLHNSRSPFTGPAAPALKWSYALGHPSYSSPTLAPDGTVYIGSNGSGLTTLDPGGHQKWSFAMGNNGFGSAAIAADGTAYIGSVDFVFYALNPDGSEQWRVTTGAIINSAPVLGDDGTVYFASQESTVYAYNADGSQKWSYPIPPAPGYPNWPGASLALADDGTLYVPSWDHNIHALNTDGTWKWSYLTSNAIYSPPSIGPDGTVYAVNWDDYMYALNPDSSLEWNFVLGAFIVQPLAIGADGAVYSGTSSRDVTLAHSVYALNTDGSLRWDFPIAGYAGGPALDAAGTVYIGTDDGTFYALNPDGSQKWIFTADSGIGSTPALGADGTVYFATNSGTVYALGPGAL